MSTKTATGFTSPSTQRNPIWGLDAAVEDAFEDTQPGPDEISRANAHFTLLFSGLIGQRQRYQVVVEQFMYVVEPVMFDIRNDFQLQLLPYLHVQHALLDRAFFPFKRAVRRSELCHSQLRPM